MKEELSDEQLNALADAGDRQLRGAPKEEIHIAIVVHHLPYPHPQLTRAYCFWRGFFIVAGFILLLVALCHAQDSGMEHQRIHIVQEGTRDDPRFLPPEITAPTHVSVINPTPPPGGGGSSISGTFHGRPAAAKPPRRH